MSDVEELLAQRAELDRRIIEAQREARTQAISQIRALMSAHGLTLADLGSRAAAPARKTTGAKVPAKYRDPATGNSWSGRGLQPKWLRAALAEGRQISDFAV